MTEQALVDRVLEDMSILDITPTKDFISKLGLGVHDGQITVTSSFEQYTAYEILMYIRIYRTQIVILLS